MAAVYEASFSETSQIAQFLGLPKWAEVDDVGLVERVEKGFPISTAERIVRRIDPGHVHLRVQDVIPKATYYRRKEDGKPLTRDLSEKILALSRVFQETLRQYKGHSRTALLFLMRDHPLLGGRSPLDMAKESTAGADLVLKILARAEAGVAT